LLHAVCKGCNIGARQGIRKTQEFVVKTVLAVLLAMWASMDAASAQMTTSPNMGPPPSAFGPDPIIQITTTFRARIEGLADARDVPTIAAQDMARRSLYNMAANECIVLAEYWKADCRLSSFYVYTDFDRPEAQPRVGSMFGQAVYELRLASLPAR
jgi:hypothetical protein